MALPTSTGDKNIDTRLANAKTPHDTVKPKCSY